jgi:hypothetical protein
MKSVVFLVLIAIAAPAIAEDKPVAPAILAEFAPRDKVARDFEAKRVATAKKTREDEAKRAAAAKKARDEAEKPPWMRTRRCCS